jgi:hypothetical protein
MKCLLIELKDKRKFFTYEKNYAQLIEFCNTFKASISVVEIKNGKLMDLPELAEAFCNGKQKSQKNDYTVINNKIKSKSNAIYTKISTFIKKSFLSRQTVSLKLLNKKYSKYGANYAKINNILKSVKSELEEKGFVIVKVSAGAYKIS